MPPIRRTLEELEARYFLEPELQDLIVEGEFDRDVMNIIFSETGDKRAVYEIDTIEVSAELLHSYGFTLGNKQRVMALALELAKSCSENCNYICFVDKDLDQWLGRVKEIRNLRWSKYTSLDAHFFTDTTLKRLLCDCCKAQIEDMSNLFLNLGEVLSKLYIIRLAAENLNLTLDWPDFTKSMSIQDGELQFDLDEFKRKLINKSRLSGKSAVLDIEIDNFSKAISGDFRYRIRGHDLVEMMAWLLKKTKGVKDFATPTAIYRLFVLEASRIGDIYAEVNQ